MNALTLPGKVTQTADIAPTPSQAEMWPADEETITDKIANRQSAFPCVSCHASYFSHRKPIGGKTGGIRHLACPNGHGGVFSIEVRA